MWRISTPTWTRPWAKRSDRFAHHRRTPDSAANQPGRSTHGASHIMPLPRDPDPASHSLDDAATSHPRRRSRSFALSSIFIFTLAVAAFLAGYGMRHGFSFLAPPVEGSWRLRVGKKGVYDVAIRRLPSASSKPQYQFPGSTVFAGIYEREGQDLVVVTPGDPRMVGLVWRWENRVWTLVAEPASRPTGATYLGATLTPKGKEPVPIPPPGSCLFTPHRGWGIQ